MTGLFGTLLLISIVVLLVGIIKPEIVIRWGTKRTRGRVALYSILSIFFCLMMIGAFADNESEPVNETTAIATSQSQNAIPSEVPSEDNVSPEANEPSEATSSSNAADATSDEITAADSSHSDEPKSTKSVLSNPKGNLIIHYIDVGQGDATLLQESNFTILIDAGRHDRQDVVPYLKSVGVETIDLFILTHPHADHIGQADKVIEAFQVEEVWASGNEHSSRTFERVLDAIMASGANYNEPVAGEEYQIGTAHITILHPGDRRTGNLNDDSLSLRMDYGNVSFLFTGDAEQHAEQQMVRSGLPLQAEILHVGHHGSRTSSTKLFLDQVKPEIAIYSAGSGNSYGHPHAEVIQRLKDMNVTVYGTDIHGSVIVTTDGNAYSVETSGQSVISEKPAAAPNAQPKTTQTPDPEPKAETKEACPPGSVAINSADFDELQKIHQIGPDRAQQIIELRQSRPFTSYSSLTRIKGIGEARAKQIEDQGIICFD